MFKLAYMNLSERLAAAMRHKGVTNKSEIARAGSVSPSNITQILKGDIKSIKGPTARGIASYCGVNAVWLEAGSGQMLDSVADHDNVQQSTPHENGRLGSMRKAFLKGTAQMGKDGYWYDLDYPDQDGDGHVVVPSDDPDVYCIRVRGDSMYPAIRDNWIVVVEPSMPLIAGQYLHVHTTDGRYMVKELLFRDQDSGALTLHSVNPSFGRLTLQAEEIVYAYYCWPIPPAKWRP